MKGKIVSYCLLIMQFAWPCQVNGQAVLENEVFLSAGTYSLSELFSQIEAKTGVSFMYQDGILDLSQHTNIKNTSQTLYSTLRLALPDDQILFTCVGKQIVIHRKKGGSQPKPDIPSGARVVYHPLYDTVKLVYFDTVVTKLVDTSVVMVYDTVVTVVEKTVEKQKLDFAIASLTEFRFSAAGSDSLAKLRSDSESPLPGFSIQALAYKKFSNVNIGAGISLRTFRTKQNYNTALVEYSEDTETVYYTSEYYDYHLSGSWQVTDFGDSVYVRHYDSTLVAERIPQVYKQQTKTTVPYRYAGRSTVIYAGLPVVVRFRLYDYKKWNVGAELGAEIGVKLLYKGPAGDNPAAPDFSVQDVLLYGNVSPFVQYDLGGNVALQLMVKSALSWQNIYKSDGAGFNMLFGFGFGLYWNR